MKAQPITQKAKGSPFKMNETLVQGAADLGSSTFAKKSKKTKPSPGNNQQPAQSISIDLINHDSKEKDQTNEKVKKENNIVEEYKPDDIVGVLNNLLKN